MSKLITIKCKNPNCSNSFNLHQSEINRKMYCCRKCRSEHHWLITPLYEKPCLNCGTIMKRKFLQKLDRLKYCSPTCRKEHKNKIFQEKLKDTIKSNCKFCGTEIINQRQLCGKLIPRKCCDKCNKEVVGKIVKEKIQTKIKSDGMYPKWKKWYDSFVKKATYGKSKLEDVVYNHLIKKTSNVLRYHSISTVYVDFLIPEKNLIIECQGDYWHMNPSKFKPDDFNKSTKRTAEQQWEKDKNRKLFLESQGYKVVELWESEINNGDYKKLDIYL